MRFEFARKKLEALYYRRNETGGFGRDVVRAFRKVMQVIASATDERDLRALRSLRFEKLRGDRKGQHSLRLNDQWRLIVTIRQDADGRTIVVIEIVDYH